jgi:hypothetical protein
VRRRILSRLGIAIATTVGVGVGVALARPDDDPSTNVNCATYRFDASAWKIGTGDPSPREQEGRAMLACRTLIGKRRAEIREMLGAPDDGDTDGPAYELGPDGLGIDSMFLDIGIRHGVVVRTSLEPG